MSVGGGTNQAGTHNDDLARTPLFWMLGMCTPFLQYENGGLTACEREAEKIEWFSGRWCKQDVPDSYPASWLVRALRLNWSVTRTPGQYAAQNVVDPRADYTPETREFFHASLRVRYGDVHAQATPPALREWTLRIGETRGEGCSGWEWVRRLPHGRELVIPELLYCEAEAPITYGETWEVLVNDPRGRVPAH